MRRFINNLKRMIKESDKKVFTVYIILRILVIFCMIREFFLGNIMNMLLCILSLILFLMPVFIEKTFKVNLPSVLEIIILLFIFAAEILGEINNYYIEIQSFDLILHTLNGFLCAGLGFSLINLLDENLDSFKLSPIFVVLVSFSFSMTVGIVWEFFEYGMDKRFGFDMQKDKYIYEIKTVELDPLNENNVVSLDNIDKVVLYDKDNNSIVELDGYLDIGLHDTMEDLFVNLIGATVFSIFGYMYIKKREKYKFVDNFIIVKNKISTN